MHRKSAPRQDVAQWGTQGGPMKRHPAGIALDYAFNRCKSYADCMFIARGVNDKKYIGRRNDAKCYFLETLMRKHQLVYNNSLTCFDA